MDKVLFQSYLIEERSYVSFIRREIHRLVRPHFDEIRTGEIDIVIAELTSNLVKHARSGELLYRLSKENEEPVFEVICIDNGPGMKDVPYSTKDGISSKNTLGQGMGAIMRQSSFSQTYSLSDWGTIVYSRFYTKPPSSYPPEKTIVRCINVAKPGEEVAGDGVLVKTIENKTLVFVGDGLGHGEHAKEAVDRAIAEFDSSMSADPAEIVREIHAGVKKTRGLVATVAVLDREKKEWQICGVGNIHTRLQRGLEYKSYIFNNGIIGLNIPGRLESSTMEMEKMQQLILCSDGIKTRWDLLKYPSILKYDPMLLAAAIYKDQARKTDDMTILIVKVV